MNLLRLAGPPLAGALAALGSLVVGCSSTHLVVGDAAQSLGDAGPSSPDAFVSPDAFAAADAFVAPDAFVVSDAGPLGGCFDGPVDILTSSVGPTQRAHARVVAAAGYGDGWIVAVTDTSGRDQLVFTGPDGAVRAVSDIDLYGGPARFFVVGDTLVSFFAYEAQRIDLVGSALGTTYPGVFLGRSVGVRAEGILAVEPLDAVGGFRALTLHYDTTAAHYLVRASEVRLDAADPSGLAVVSGTLAEIPGLDLANAQFFLDGEHVRIFSGAGGWHVRDVQLGLGDLTSAGGVVGVRVWSDVVWPDAPYAVLDLTTDRTQAMTARVDPDTSAHVGHLEAVPTASGSTPPPFPVTIDLGYGTPHAAITDDLSQLVIASPAGLSVLRREDGAPLLEPIAIDVHAGVLLARRGDQVAAAFVADPEDRRVALRCVSLPSAF